MQSSFRAVAPGCLALSGCPAGGKTEGRAGSSSLSLLLDFPLSRLHAVLDHYHNKFSIQLGSVSDKMAYYTASLSRELKSKRVCLPWKLVF